MKMKSEKARLKAIERRAKWFEKRAKDDPVIKLAKEKIDKSFAEDEYANAYAMFTDLITHSYPFVGLLGLSIPKNVSDAAREKYGFDWSDVEFMFNIVNEARKEFSDEFDIAGEEEAEELVVGEEVVEELAKKFPDEFEIVGEEDTEELKVLAKIFPARVKILGKEEVDELLKKK